MNRRIDKIKFFLVSKRLIEQVDYWKSSSKLFKSRNPKPDIEKSGVYVFFILYYGHWIMQYKTYSKSSRCGSTEVEVNNVMISTEKTGEIRKGDEHAKGWKLEHLEQVMKNYTKCKLLLKLILYDKMHGNRRLVRKKISWLEVLRIWFSKQSPNCLEQ